MVIDIARVASTKYLGVIVSEDMKWNELVTNVANKISKSLGGT